MMSNHSRPEVKAVLRDNIVLRRLQKLPENVRQMT
jgi:hypothetical protein